MPIAAAIAVLRAGMILIVATLFAATLLGPASGPAHGATPAEEVVDLYERFVAAQNRRDIPAVRDLLLPDQRFLWVRDGKAFWGPDSMVERMSRFQAAEVWRVEPDRERRRFVAISGDSGYLYQPLTLRIGAAASADAIAFLVSVLCIRTPDGWRIAALLTTVENP